MHQTVGKQEKELPFFQQRQNGVCQHSLLLRHVNLQTSKVFNPRILQEILYRDSHR